MPELGDDSFDVGHSEGNNTSNDKDVLEHQTRDRMLDDALFGFFRKQAVKSLKRNFSDFCKDFTPSNEDTTNATDGLSRTAFTRYSLKYFVEVIRKLTQKQRSIIAKFGFGCLLLLDLYDIPSEFARWVADSVDPLCSQITVDYKPIDISKQIVHLILGLPIDGLEVPCNSNDGKDFILSHFQLSEMPHITFFGNKLSGSEELSEHDVFVCFMSVAISCFLCPSLREYPNSKYLSVLKHPEAAKGYDFSKLVYECCLNGINQFSMSGKLKGRRPKAPVCCNYVPAVHYLDCLDFGRQNVDQSILRIAVWRGNMIRFFSDLDQKRRNCFGKRHLKEGLASYRTQGIFPIDASHKKSMSPIFAPVTSDFKKIAHTRFVSNLQPEVIDGILNIAEKFVANKSATNKPKMDLLVNNLLDFLCNSSYAPKLGAGKCGEPETSNAMENAHKNKINVLAASICANANIVGLGELGKTPTPSKHASPQVFQPNPMVITDAGTPECMITKVVEPHSLTTAPVMNPLKKVKARRCHLISEGDEQNILIHRPESPTRKDPARAHDFLSPVGRINLSPCAEPRTGDYNITCLQKLQQAGSKQAPILVAETSPKPPVEGTFPNVQMLGSNDFRRRCSELAKKADITYNHLLHNQHAKTGVSAPQGFLTNVQPEAQIHNVQTKTLCPGRRKHRFMNLLMTGQSPPLQLNSKFPVTDDDIINYSAIVELAHSAQHKKKKHPAVSGRHYFFPHVGEAILKYNLVHNESVVRTSFLGAAKASRGRNLRYSDNKLFFPIVDSHHWFVFVVDFEYKVFAFLDSFHDKNSNFHQRMKDTLIDNFVHLWELIFSAEHNFDNFRAMYPHVPKQQTLIDCGIFSMKCMEIWKPFTDLRTLFSHEDILNIRIQYANKLYFLSENEADLSLVTDYYTKV